MKKLAKCRSCRKEVAPSDAVCGNCGAPNPAAAYDATKLIIAAAALLLVAGMAATWFRHDTKTASLAVGQTYIVAKPSRVCLTVNGLRKANHNDVVTIDQAARLGCLIIDPARISRVTVVDKSAVLVKVRVLAPELPANNFEGWTDIESIEANSAG